MRNTRTQTLNPGMGPKSPRRRGLDLAYVVVTYLVLEYISKSCQPQHARHDDIRCRLSDFDLLSHLASYIPGTWYLVF